MPLVAIVGRPNVGKSTFFNRLTESRQSIVHDEPGVTRDRVYGDAEWNGVAFNVVDTGGYVQGSSDQFEEAIREQVDIALAEADAVLFIVDVTTGTTDLDDRLASILRKSDTPTFVVANKADNATRRLDAMEFYAFGLGEPYPLSSINGSGTGELLDELVKVLPAEVEPEDTGALRIALIGRPNVGKSSLTNALLGEERTIVTDVAGTTRDSIDAPLTWHDRDLVLVDTAGLRRRSRVHENIEFYSTLRTQRAIESCDVALLLIDATTGLEAQDIKVLKDAETHRKGLGILVNKWDLLPDKDTNTPRDYAKNIRERLQTLSYVPIQFISATTGQRVGKVLELATTIGDERKKRISTSKLNEVVQAAFAAHHPPTYRGAAVRIKFATQVRTEPPTFAFFANHPKGVGDSYKRYLENKVRAAFGFEGVPMGIVIRQK